MPRIVENALTPLWVKNVKEPGRYADGGSLYLQVSASRTKSGRINKSWLFLYRTASDKGMVAALNSPHEADAVFLEELDELWDEPDRGPQASARKDSAVIRRARAVAGKLRYAGLGGYPLVSLANARAKARRLRLERLDTGVDPIQRKKDLRQAAAVEASLRMSFQACGEAYIKAHQAEWRSARSADDWRRSLAYATPILGKLSVAKVGTAQVLKVLEPIWTSKPDTATRVRGRIEAVLDWAKAGGYRTGENPARWQGHLENLLAAPSKLHTVTHRKAADYKQIATVMAAIRARDGVAARALEFIILTAARPGEVSGMRWSEIDQRAKVWTIPAERTKTNKEHRVPLCAAALAVLPAHGRDGDLVFVAPKGGALNHINLLKITRQLGDRWTVHGFRSTFRDWCGDATTYPRELAEAALAHTVGNDAERAYRRGDALERRRVMMEDWANFCAKPPATDSAIVSIRRAR